MDAAILVVGDELLSGHTRDTNGAFLAGRLTGLGHRVVAMRVAPDDDEAIARDLHELLARAPLVVVTGGLGPTHDDHTTDAVAQAFGLDLVVDEPSFERLRARYARLYPDGYPDHVLDAGRKMVTVPTGATALPNPKGAAAGYAVQRPEGVVVVLPGVPREAEAMWDRHVAGAVVPSEVPLAEATVEVALPEAAFGARLKDVAARHPTVHIGSYPRLDRPAGLVRLRGPEADVAAALKDVEAVFRDLTRV